MPRNFIEQCLLLAIMGYTEVHQVPHEDLGPVTRAWLSDRLAKKPEMTTQEVKLLSYSFCELGRRRVADHSEFNQECNLLLSLAARFDPPYMAQMVMHLRQRHQPKGIAEVIQLNRLVSADSTHSVAEGVSA